MIDLVLGLGQGGSRLAKEFSDVYDVQGRYMNLTRVDFSKLKVPRNHILLFEYGGSGKDPRVGEYIVRHNVDSLYSFLDDALQATNARRVAICVGGGGGSGTGFMFPTIEYLQKRRIGNILLVYTMPLKAEGMPTKPNALIALNRVIEKYIGRGKAKSKQVAPLLIDNEFCINKYGENRGGGFWKRLNRGVVYALKRFYNLTDLEHFKNYVDMTSGYGALDYREFMKILFFKEGLLDVREVTFETPDASQLGKSLKTSSLVFGSLDIRTSKAYIVSLAVPELWRSRRIVEFTEEVFKIVAKLTKTPYVLRSSYYNSKLTNAKLSILAAGMNKSHGLDKILKQTAKDVEKFRSKEDMQPLDLSKLEY